MIVCVCHCLRRSELDQACADGVREACDFYSRHGCAPKCGKCVDYVEDYLDRRMAPVPIREPQQISAF